MNRVLAAFLALALLGGLLPLVEAHVESYNQSRALQAGPYLVFFEPRPSPPFANKTASLVAQVSDAGTGTLIARIPATVLVAGPEFTQRKAMESDGTGYLIASMILPHPGNYSARVFVTDPKSNETYAADTEFEVFPDIPYRILPLDQSVDVYAGARTKIAFQVLDHLTLEPADLPDLSVRLEHWSEDHKTFISSEDAATTKGGYGVWRIDHVFGDKGMYHMRFASKAGGFNYADVPLLHVYALPAVEAPPAKTPALGIGALVAFVALVALLRKR